MRTFCRLVLALTACFMSGCAYTSRMSAADSAESALYQVNAVGRDRGVGAKAVHRAKEYCAAENKRYLFVKHHYKRKSSIGVEWFSYDLYFTCVDEGDPRLAAPPSRRSPGASPPATAPKAKTPSPQEKTVTPSPPAAAPVVPPKEDASPAPAVSSQPGPPPPVAAPATMPAGAPVVSTPPAPAEPERSAIPGQPVTSAPLPEEPAHRKPLPADGSASGSPQGTPPLSGDAAGKPSAQEGAASPPATDRKKEDPAPTPPLAPEQAPIPAPTANTPGEPEGLDTSGVGPVIKVIPGSYDRKTIKEEKM